MLLVIALGGNALLPKGAALTDDTQRRAVARAVNAIAPLAREHRIVITHGNGPQVGMLAQHQDAAGLDVVGAETQGLIGFLIGEALRGVLPEREIATLLTQVAVDPKDPAFTSPTKPIGHAYDEAHAQALSTERGWRMRLTDRGFQRVVASPEPLRILELGAIRILLEAGVIVVCAGGGGIPVVVSEGGAIRGAEAVIDKDLASALLATQLEADHLLLLTDVAAVYDGWGTDRPEPIRRATAREMRARSFAAGSMAPKVEAACRFAEATGRSAGIGALEDVAAIFAGEAGTTIVP